MLKQGLELKQTQKLSPLQIQTIKLIEMPVELNFSRIQSFGRIKFRDVWKMFTDTWKIWWNLKIKKNYFK